MNANDPNYLKGRLRYAALNFLARREHSRKELHQKLLRHSDDESLIESVIMALEQEGLQSDTRFAQMYVRARFNKGLGPVRISGELSERGIAAELIDESLEEYDELWLSAMARSREIRFSAQRPATFPEQAKQMRFLQYRGFSTEQIKQLFKTDILERI